MPAHPGTNDSAPQASELPPGERITAIVPARNEEQVITTCVRSLAQQAEIAEIVVVNDQSTDRTAEIVRVLTAEIPRLRLLETQGVPPGWVGKNHAVWLGAQEAGGPWLLVTDAGAALLAGAAGRALHIAKETGRAPGLVSPEQLPGGGVQKL